MKTGGKTSKIWLAHLLFLTALLAGCSSTLATADSDPYTAEDVIAMTEEEFAANDPRLVLIETQIEKEKPFERRVYVLHDTANDFTFSARAVVRSPDLPRPGAERDMNAFFAYAEGYAAHLNAAIGQVAAAYGFRAASTEEAEALMHSGAKRNHLDREVALFDEGDFIFVMDGARGADMGAVCKRLYDLYRPQGDGTVLSRLYGRKVTFYYLPPNETELSRAVFVAAFRLEGRYDWTATLAENPGSSSNEKDAAILEQNLARYFESCLHRAKETRR